MIAEGVAPSTVGATSELLVCVDLMMKGYAVFRCVSPAAKCDLIVLCPDGLSSFRVEVKTGYRTISGEIRGAKPYSDAFDVLALVVYDTPPRVLYQPDLPLPSNTEPQVEASEPDGELKIDLGAVYDSGNGISAPTFTEEWESAPRWATRTTEQIAAEYWFLRGGQAKEIQLTATINQDLKEIRRVAGERLATTIREGR